MYMLIAIINTWQIVTQLKRQLSNNQTSLTNLLLKIVDTPPTGINITFSTPQSHLFTVRKHLQHENINARIAAIDELEKFWQKYPQYHEEVTGILAEFIQNHPGESHSDEFHTHVSAKIPRDMQAALTVIASKNTHQGEDDEPLDLSYSDMRGANLHQADLEFSNLYHVNLTGANLSGANLSGTILTAANLSGANLSGANLSGAILSAANLCGANLTEANLQNANLYLANLQGCTLNDTILKGANLREVRFG
jgi:uncharacterized protein YjbI with pentapeptide repeats